MSWLQWWRKEGFPSGVYSQLAGPWFLTNHQTPCPEPCSLPFVDEFPAAAATGDHKLSGLTPYKFRGFPGGPVIKNIPCLAMHEMQFSPWSGNQDLTGHRATKPTPQLSPRPTKPTRQLERSKACHKEGLN